MVGLTGNIATGKSAVMRLAAERGALTIDADKVVHDIMDSNPDIQAAIAVAFGSNVRRADGRIDRRTLGKIVFNDPDALRDLETIVHPAVRREIARRITESDARVVFIEAIKLLEGGLADACHQIWVTRCSQQRQLDRLMICRGMDKQSALARIKAQPPQEEKVALADVVIDTNGLMTETEAQFDIAWSRLPDITTAPLKTIVIPAEEGMVATQKATNKEVASETAETAPPPATEPAPSTPSVTTTETADVPLPEGDVQVRRARPTDIPAILLLMQRATGGAVKMKRTDLLMALSERSYFIGQVGTDVTTVMGWSIDSQVARIDQIFIYPLAMATTSGTAVLEEIEKSANAHIGEIIVAFLPPDTPAPIQQLFTNKGFKPTQKEGLPPAWKLAIEESQPPNTTIMMKSLRDDRLKKIKK
ncbi:MAG: dephospho-CoA kinase [Chloroflexi bacterium]|nr:MAG: dephospho-CoA kinase [Chloroflexota bacterium]